MKDITPVASKSAKSKKLTKILKNDAQVVQDVNIVNEDMFNDLRAQLAREEDNENLLNYHPLVEIAKIGVNPLSPDDLKLKCHETIASYIYPKVKSFEVSSKSDNTLNVNINVRSFSKKQDEIEPEDIESEEGEDEDGPRELNYQDFVLKQMENKKKEEFN